MRWFITMVVVLALAAGWVVRRAHRRVAADSVPQPPAHRASAASPLPLPSAEQMLPLPSGEPAPNPVRLVTFNGRQLAHQDDGQATLAMAEQRRAWGAERTELVLLGLSRIPDPAERTRLRQQGIALLSYVPDGGWVARVRGLAGPERDEPVTLFHPFDAGLRLDSALAQPAACDAIPLFVYLAEDGDAQSVMNHVREFGSFGLHTSGRLRHLAGRVPPERMEQLTARLGAHPDVQYVARGAGARLLNRASARVLQSGSYSGPLPVWSAGLYGSNQVVAVLDTGIDADSCYFRDPSGSLPPVNRLGETNRNSALRKVIAVDFLYAGDDPNEATDWDNDGHGTRVSGHALGSAVNDPTGTNNFNGMAPGALLVAQDAASVAPDNCADLIGLGCPVTNYLPAMQQAYRHGARIHNNSWGDNENASFTNLNAYTQASRDVDEMAWQRRDFLVVCAAGNSGGPFDKVSSPSTAKNGLSVAASEGGSSQESMASFSSRGWTQDGRIKPDLAAPGSLVIASSCDFTLVTSNCATATGSGTSYASPMVAGLAALVRDYFASGFYPGGSADPTNARPWISAALVKAVLINACQRMSNAVAAPPSRDQGWGRVNLSRTLIFANAAQSLWVSDGEKNFQGGDQPLVRYLDVMGTSLPLNVTLVWTDYPGTPGADKQLINDLDLVVRTHQQTFLGNSLSNGISVEGGSFDRSNNVEQVIWRAPVTGLVEISVWTHAVPEATQDFALVVSGDAQLRPLETDEDGDGISDARELWQFGALTNSGAGTDFDGDGYLDSDELIAGTDPEDDADALDWTQMVWTADGAWEMSALGRPGCRHQVQWRPSGALGEGWRAYSNQPAGEAVVDRPFSNRPLVFRDTFSSNDTGEADTAGGRVYRLLVEASENE